VSPPATPGRREKMSERRGRSSLVEDLERGLLFGHSSPNAVGQHEEAWFALPGL
jgi:hypothetical protein